MPIGFEMNFTLSWLAPTLPCRMAQAGNGNPRSGRAHPMIAGKVPQEWTRLLTARFRERNNASIAQGIGEAGIH